MQDEISRAVARSLEVQLIGHTRSRPLVLAAANVDAYNLHLLGRYHAANRSVAELERARAFLNKPLKPTRPMLQPMTGWLIRSSF